MFVMCNKAYSDKSSLINHKCIHSGERPYVCDVCNKEFSRQSNLIRQRLHSGERPYVCDLCNKAYNDKSSLINRKPIRSR